MSEFVIARCQCEAVFALLQVGDIRVMFESAGRSDIGGGGQGEMVSVIGQQTGHTISHYETQAGDPLLLLYMGDHSAKVILCNLTLMDSLTLTVLVATIDAQWEGMGDVGSVRYEPALLPPMPDRKGFKLQ